MYICICSLGLQDNWTTIAYRIFYKHQAVRGHNEPLDVSPYYDDVTQAIKSAYFMDGV